MNFYIGYVLNLIVGFIINVVKEKCFVLKGLFFLVISCINGISKGKIYFELFLCMFFIKVFRYW